MKKAFGNILAALAVVLLAVSCEKAEPSSFYSIQVLSPNTADMPFGYVYANEDADSLCFLSYSPWRIDVVDGDADFVSINGKLSGAANMIVRYGVAFKENTSGKSRYATFRISDSEDDSRARATFSFMQFATRQDGSLGNAAEVRSITGSDGSSITIDYDTRHRPVELSMSADGMNRKLSFSYDDREKTVTATQEKYEFTYADTLFNLNKLTFNGSCLDRYLPAMTTYIYQPRMLMSLTSGTGNLVNTFNGRRTDVAQSVGYQAFVNGNYEYSYANGFMVKNTIEGKFAQAYGFYYNGKGSLSVDSLHLADSIGVERIYSDNTHKAEMYRLTYSGIDNRTTTIDVNQLMEGVAQCDPFMLLSFYKLARQTSVISKAEGKNGARYIFNTTTNADGSIKTVTIDDANGGAITYTFGY